MNTFLKRYGWTAPVIAAAVCAGTAMGGPIGNQGGGLGVASQHVTSGPAAAALQGLQNGQTGQDLAALVAQSAGGGVPAIGQQGSQGGASAGLTHALQHIPPQVAGYDVVQAIKDGISGPSLAGIAQSNSGSNGGLAIALDHVSSNAGGVAPTALQHINDGLTGQDLANAIRPATPPHDFNLPPQAQNNPFVPAPPTMMLLGLAGIFASRRRNG